jgi:pyruvate ferredoxin oxidoreductase gamma subunit
LIEVRWHARGGQGGFTAARLLGLAASVFEDNYAQAFPSFGPERRGAPVLGFTRIDDKPIDDHSQVYECDYVVVLDETLMKVVDVKRGLRDGGMLLINTELAP